MSVAKYVVYTTCVHNVYAVANWIVSRISQLDLVESPGAMALTSSEFTGTKWG